MANRNERLFDCAKAVILGGVNSLVRSFGHIGGVPRFISKADGAFVWNENDRHYIDYVCSWSLRLSAVPTPKC